MRKHIPKRFGSQKNSENLICQKKSLTLNALCVFRIAGKSEMWEFIWQNATAQAKYMDNPKREK